MPHIIDIERSCQEEAAPSSVFLPFYCPCLLLPHYIATDCKRTWRYVKWLLGWQHSYGGGRAQDKTAGQFLSSNPWADHLASNALSYRYEHKHLIVCVSTLCVIFHLTIKSFFPVSYGAPRCTIPSLHSFHSAMIYHSTSSRRVCFCRLYHFANDRRTQFKTRRPVEALSNNCRCFQTGFRLNFQREMGEKLKYNQASWRVLL